MDFNCFSKLNLNNNLLNNLKNLSLNKMTEIQSKSLKDIIQGRDVLAQAKTGSGKTLAFALGILNKIKTDNKKTQSLVLCPTRELAQQVANEIRKLARTTENVKVLELCGGTPFTPQKISLEFGAHCIVGTPGRVFDHLKRNTFNCKFIETFVLDEADRMLDMGFHECLTEILKYLPSKRQTLLFSATYPSNIENLSNNIQKNVKIIKVESQTNDKQDIDEIFYKVSKNSKNIHTVNILNSYKPESCIIFCNTKEEVKALNVFLNKKSFSSLAIHGDLNQKEREETLVLFKNQSCSILIATDVAARGIHIDNLNMVINYDLSKDPHNHIHRIGRTGRAGQKGLAVNLYSESESFKKDQIEKTTKNSAKEKNIKDIELNNKSLLKAPMISFRIENGKKNKLRPTDILGALTAQKLLSGSDVGRINIFDFHSFVAIKREKENIAEKLLSNYPIKGRFLKTKKVFS